jgi:G3E family GTPase
MFGEFYPNPGTDAVVSMPLAIAAEALGTFLLLLFIFALTEGCNVGRPSDAITPVFIGLTVASIICLIAPLTQAGLNPARDFSPRLVAWMAGWGSAAFPDSCGGFFWVYILAPIAGGVLASFFWLYVVEPNMKRKSRENGCEESRNQSITSKNVKVILTGGFLGAGKTTLLWKASQQLKNRGKNVGLITNDQAPELVDSTLLMNHGLRVAEVSGSCFCCNFNGFIDAVQEYNIDRNIDYIIAEPVGSCTDLSATIMQPLKQYWSEKIGIAPLSVLADPERLAMILDGGNAGLHEDAAYIFRKQLEESDIILINKIDLLTAEQLSDLVNKTKQAYPNSTVMTVSAMSGEGIDAWLDEVIRRDDSGNRLVEVDYDIYAHGEAVLGWLNGTVELSSETADWDKFITSFVKDLCARFEKDNLPIGHVKAVLENVDSHALMCPCACQYLKRMKTKLGNDDDTVVVNFTGGVNTISVRGTAGTGSKCKLTINARVETTPENLDAIVRSTLNAHSAKFTCTEIAWKYLQPGRPNPTYRFDKVVK